MPVFAERPLTDSEPAATSFEAPVQPVRARPLGVGIVLAAVVAGTGLLVWLPWSTGPEEGPRPTLPSTAAAPASAIPRAALPTPVPVVYTSPRALPLLPAGSLVAAPPAERFRARWSVVGVTEVPGGEPRITQLPVVTTAGFIEGGSPAEVCRIGRLRSAFVALLPARQMRLLGIAAPASGIVGATEMTRVDMQPLPAYEVPVRPLDAGAEVRAVTRLFARADLLLWGEGVYRFLSEGPDGTPHFLYACLVGPGQVDGT